MGQRRKQEKLSIFDTFFPTQQQSRGYYSQAKKAISRNSAETIL